MVTGPAGSLASGAAGVGCLDSLADLGLGRVPASLEHQADLVGGQWRGLQDERLHRVAARRLEVLGSVALRGSNRRVDDDRDLVDLLALAQLECGLPGGLAELVAVLPDVHMLLAQRQVVQVGGVAVLAAQWWEPVVLRLKGSCDSESRAVILGKDRLDLRVRGV